jgi:hypothetical protein
MGSTNDARVGAQVDRKRLKRHNGFCTCQPRSIV